MAITVLVPNYKLLPSVAQRVLCWAGPTLRGRVGVNTSFLVHAITIPDALILTLGPLVLREGGPDITAGFAAGQNVLVSAGNGDALFINPVTCPVPPGTPPEILDFQVTVPATLDVELTYDNSASGTGVFVDWGDGVIEDLSGDAAGTFPHTYPLSGVWTVRVEDAGDPASFSLFQVAVPENALVN